LIIAYGGGLILSLYQIKNPLEELENSLKSDPHYVLEKNGDFLRVRFSDGSNVATAHPTAAELRGMPCRRLTTQFYSKSKSFTYCINTG